MPQTRPTDNTPVHWGCIAPVAGLAAAAVVCAGPSPFAWAFRIGVLGALASLIVFGRQPGKQWASEVAFPAFLLSAALAVCTTPTAYEVPEKLVPMLVMLASVAAFMGGLSALTTAHNRRRGDFAPQEPERPGSSPVPWIADRVWRQRAQLSRAPGLYSEARVDAPMGDVDPVPVPDEVYARAPLAPQPLHIAPSGAPEEALEGSPHAGFWWNPGQWPVCCDQLATLVLANPTRSELAPYEATNPLDGGLEELDVGAELLQSVRDGEPHEQAVNIFQCGSCQRMYVAVSFT